MFVMSYSGGFNSAAEVVTTQLADQGSGLEGHEFISRLMSITVGFPSEQGFVFTRNKFHFPTDGRGKS